MIRSIAIASMTLMIASLAPAHAEAASRRAKIGAAVAGGMVAGVITTVVVDKAIRSSRERNVPAQQPPVVQTVVIHAPQQLPTVRTSIPQPPVLQNPRPESRGVRQPKASLRDEIFSDEFGNSYTVAANGMRVYVSAAPASHSDSSMPVAAAPAATSRERVFAQQAAQPTPQPAASAADAREIESQTMQLVNQHRASLGLAPFAYAADVALLAREHSQNMGSGKVAFGHANFASRVARAGRGTSAAENVAYSTRVDQAANDALASWLKSPGHRANLEGNRHVSGVGAAVGSDGKIYLTQIFFRR